MSHMILGAGYIGPFSGTSWITTIAVILIGVFLFWILYKLVFCRIKWGDKKREIKDEKVERIVITGDEKVDAEGITTIHSKEEDVEADEVIAMPLSGELMPLTKVPDPIFSEKMVGDGFAIKPNKGEILSPVNGVIKDAHSSKASITINSSSGRDVILHIGLNTKDVGHEAISFEIKEGDCVKVGQHIGFLDLDKINHEQALAISPVVFPNLKETERVVVKQQGIVEAGMKGIVVIEKDEGTM